MHITIYTTPGCGPCVATKRALDWAGLSYVERAGADWPEEVERLSRLAGLRQAPVVDTGGQVWSGFRADLIAKLANDCAED